MKVLIEDTMFWYLMETGPHLTWSSKPRKGVKTFGGKGSTSLHFSVLLRPLALVRPREANPWPSHSSVKRSNWANPAAVISLQNWRHILYLTEQFRDSSMIKDSQFNSSPTPFPNICILFQEFQQRQSGQTYQHNCEGWAYKCPNKARWYRYPTSKTQRRIRLKITVLKK